MEDLIVKLSLEILQVKKLLLSLHYESPMNVDSHDADVDYQAKKLETLRRIRTELEEAI